MHTVLIYAGGRQVDALLLSASPDCLRVVVPGHGDTEELHMDKGHWKSDRGVRIEIGALLVDDGMSTAHFERQAEVQVLTAV